jgi:hypothetical protein
MQWLAYRVWELELTGHSENRMEDRVSEVDLRGMLHRSSGAIANRVPGC